MRAVGAMTDDELRTAFSDTLAQAEQLRVALLVLGGEIDRRALWAEDGAGRYPDWIASHSTLTRAEARRLDRCAGALRDMPVMTEAMVSGELSTQKAELLVSACTSETKAAFADQEQSLVDMAKEVAVDRLPARIRMWKQRVDRDGPVAAYERLRARRSASLQQLRDGTWQLEAILDPEAGAILDHQLREVASELWRADQADPEHEPRTVGQRNADALVEIVRRSTAAPIDRCRIAQPLLIVHTDVETLNGGEGDSTVADGDIPVPGEAVRRLACDSILVRLVKGAGSEVLDFGREIRTANAVQKRALICRDGPTCVVPGCSVKAAFCQAHHLQHFRHGGPTDFNNLAMVCHRHHHRFHEGDWNLIRHPDGRFEQVPPPKRRQCAAA